MVQVFIMPRRVNPSVAAVNGADRSVCGDCKLRTRIIDGKRKRACYVTPFQAPLAVFKAWQRGRYPRMPDLAAVAELHRGQSVRLGAWGDPAAAPFELTRAITKYAKSFTGYTHAWRYCDKRFRQVLMASVDDEEEFAIAQKKGWRTFRSRSPDVPLLSGEVTCPASAEAGHRTTCTNCTLCNGNHTYRRAGQRFADPRKSVAIIAHGQGRALFTDAGKRLLPMLSTPVVPSVNIDC